MKDHKDMVVIQNEIDSCAGLMIECINDAGIDDIQSCFRHHIDNSKNMGLMPDDLKVVKQTMADYGFHMQGAQLERKAGIQDIISSLKGVDVPITIFISTRSCYNNGGRMLAFRYDGKECQMLCSNPVSKKYVNARIKHVWLRWDDGVNRSPYLRKRVNKDHVKIKKREEIEDTKYFQYYQPNPCGNFIGDCVVRGISKVLDITWNEALECLSVFGCTTVNTEKILSCMLEERGFVHYKPMTREGKRLSGKAFCDEMNKIYCNGERILAHVGRLHVAAIIPDDKDHRYKIFDCWNSSERTVGEYWVKKVDKPKKNVEIESEEGKSLTIGDKILHPSFKEGVVIDVTTNIVTVDFGVNGRRRLNMGWIFKHCTV